MKCFHITNILATSLVSSTEKETHTVHAYPCFPLFLYYSKVRVLLAANLMSCLSVILRAHQGADRLKPSSIEEIFHITVAEANYFLPSTENTNKHYIFTFPFCCLIRERCPGDCSAMKQEKLQLFFFSFCSFVNRESLSLSLL